MSCAGCAARRKALMSAGRAAAFAVGRTPIAVAHLVERRPYPASPLAALFAKVRGKTSGKR